MYSTKVYLTHQHADIACWVCLPIKAHLTIQYYVYHDTNQNSKTTVCACDYNQLLLNSKKETVHVTLYSNQESHICFFLVEITSSLAIHCPITVHPNMYTANIHVALCHEHQSPLHTNSNCLLTIFTASTYQH